MSIAILLILAIAAFLAGIGGSYLGIGGGVFLIPFMTLVLSVNIKVAIATSLIGVIATSSGAASVYVRDHLTNLRLAMFLEVATTLGGIAGALVGLRVPELFLYFAFGVMVLYAAAAMARVREPASQRAYQPGAEPRLAVMVIIGVFSGTNLGTRLLEHSKASNVRFAFAVFLAATGLAMLLSRLPGVSI